MTLDNKAKLAVAYSGLVWGLFWLPLRALESVGIAGPWAILLFYAVPALICLPFAIFSWRQHRNSGPWLPILGIATALPLVIYSIAVLNTEVVRAMLLFYLTPVWSMILGRIFLKEKITPIRWATLAVAFIGVSVVLKVEDGFPLPRNFGDWMALTGGFLWAVSCVFLRLKQGLNAALLCQQNLIWSGIISVPVLWLMSASQAPALGLVLAQLWWLVPALIAMVITGVYASMWGAPKLSPTIVGILYMTEIIAGATSAAIWAGEPFGWREITGITLITIAAALESIWEMWQSQKNQREPLQIS
jgi:drug/metabolite transporter (DMT)-like permease